MAYGDDQQHHHAVQYFIPALLFVHPERNIRINLCSALCNVTTEYRLEAAGTIDKISRCGGRKQGASNTTQRTILHSHTIQSTCCTCCSVARCLRCVHSFTAQMHGGQLCPSCVQRTIGRVAQDIWRRSVPGSWESNDWLRRCGYSEINEWFLRCAAQSLIAAYFKGVANTCMCTLSGGVFT